jgi:hypothetical protein
VIPDLPPDDPDTPENPDEVTPEVPEELPAEVPDGAPGLPDPETQVPDPGDARSGAHGTLGSAGNA